MTESRASLYQLLTWVFLAALIGVYVLYHWYAGVLKEEIAGQSARIAQASQQLKAGGETEQGLKAQLTDLEGRLASLQAEHQTLAGTHEVATAQVAALSAEAEQRKQEAAAAAAREQELAAATQALGVQYEAVRKGLASKLDAAHNAWSEAEAEHQSAKGHTKELEAEVGRLKRALAAAESKYAAESKGLEAKVEERTRVFRTALEGSDPERAAQIAALEQAEQAGQDAEAELTEKLAAAQRSAEEQAQALAKAKEEQEGVLSEWRGKVFALNEELQSVRNELGGVEQKHDQTVAELRAELDQAAQTLAGVRTEFSTTVAAATQEKQALDARIASLEQDLDTQRNQGGAWQQSDETLADLRKQSVEAPAVAQSAPAQAEALVQTATPALVPAPIEAEAQVQTPTPTPTPTEAEAENPTPSPTDSSALLDQYAQLHAQKTEGGMLISLPDQQLHFPSGVSTLPKGDIASLDQIAALLKGSPQLTAVVEGHTDSSGPDAVNLAVSKARAESVRQGLIARGIAPGRLTARGLGKSRPVSENSTAAGRLNNRRVEVLVIEPAP